MSGGTGNGVFVPTMNETLQFENLGSNWDQTTKYIEIFCQEKEELAQTYDECQDIIRNEFKKLRELLTNREEELLKELEIKYEERDSSQENQINLLENHKKLNEDTENDCKHLIATKQQRSERKEREEMITSLGSECINKSPVLKEVPIDLKHTFNKQKQLIDIIASYGKLICRGIERGKSRKFTYVETDTKQTEVIVGAHMESDRNNNQSIKNNKIGNVDIANNNKNNHYDEKENDYYNNNVNGYNHGEKEGEEEDNSSSNVSSKQNVNVVLLSKVRLSVSVSVGNEITPKPKNVILLKNDKKNEYTLDSIKFKIKNVKLIKDLKRDDIIYKFTLLENNKEICNNNDLIEYVISKAKDEKTPINMKAQVTNVWM